MAVVMITELYVFDKNQGKQFSASGSYLSCIPGTCRRCLLPFDFNRSSERENSASELSASVSYIGLDIPFTVVGL